MRSLLKGVKVLELSTYVAAPGAGRILSDMGADVIKIEPATGDPHRRFGQNVNAPVSDEENPCFQLSNANKRAIAINLKTEEGLEVFYALLKDSNIFLSNTRIESLRKMKIAYEDLKDRFPHLIYGHLSGYGFKGEDAGLPGYDITAFWARGGGMADLAFEGDGPIATPYAVGDNASAMALTTGLLGALYQQRMTGKGEYVLISLFGVSIWINSLMLTPLQYGDEWPKNRYRPTTPMTTTYVCKDGEMVTLSVLDYVRDWPKFCDCMGLEDYKDDPRYKEPIEVKKPENNETMVRILIDIFKKNDRAYWLERLTSFDLPFSKTQHFREVIDDPMAWDNGYLTKFTFETGNTAAIPNTPIHFGEFKAPPCDRAPNVGEHTNEILAELGYDDATIKKLNDSNAVKQRA